MIQKNLPENTYKPPPWPIRTTVSTTVATEMIAHSVLTIWILFLLATITNIEIGWDLPGCPPGGAPGSCHPPTAPVLPHIPNSTGVIIQPTSCSSLESSVDNKYNYGCCAPPPPGELVTQDLVQENFTVPHRIKLDKPGCWIRGTQGSIPAGAVVGGQEPDGQPLYVARAEYEGSLTPGKVRSSWTT